MTLEKQTPGRPKCFSSPSGGRTPQGGGLGGALKPTGRERAERRANPRLTYPSGEGQT